MTLPWRLFPKLLKFFCYRYCAVNPTTLLLFEFPTAFASPYSVRFCMYVTQSASFSAPLMVLPPENIVLTPEAARLTSSSNLAIPVSF